MLFKPFYSRWQQFIASLLVATLVGPLIILDIEVQKVHAKAPEQELHLALVLVEQSLFDAEQIDDTTSLTGKVSRYARDIQRTLPDTAALVVPVP